MIAIVEAHAEDLGRVGDGRAEFDRCERYCEWCFCDERFHFPEGFSSALQEGQQVGKTRAFQAHDLVVDNNARVPMAALLERYESHESASLTKGRGVKRD